MQAFNITIFVNVLLFTHFESFECVGILMSTLTQSGIACLFRARRSLRESCDIGFRVQFNAEFPRQVMYFPIESLSRKTNSHILCDRTYLLEKVVLLR